LWSIRPPSPHSGNLLILFMSSWSIYVILKHCPPGAALHSARLLQARVYCYLCVLLPVCTVYCVLRTVHCYLGSVCTACCRPWSACPASPHPGAT
jgi:hypothetical protein